MPLPVRLASLAVVLAVLPACRGGDDDDDAGTPGYEETGRVEITLIVPPAAIPAQDPFLGVTTLHVAILDSAGTVLIQDDFGIDEDVEIRSLDPGTARVVLLEGRDAVLAPVSRGRTLPLDIVVGDTVERTLYFSRVGETATVYGAPVARTGAATATFSDGRVLIAGGLDGGGTALASAEVFDWETDAIVSAGTMGTGLAFSATASLGNDTLLIAGGVDDSAGTPSGAARVYEHVPGGVGTWTDVPPMPAIRREHAAAEMGVGRVFVAGGTATAAATGPSVSTTFLFEWDGTAGVWSAGPAMNEPRMGAIALPASGDVVLIVAGLNAVGGGDDFSQDVDIFNWNGSTVTLTPGGGPQINTSRGWSGVVEVGANQWLVWGGEEDGGGGGHRLISDVDLWTWTGSMITEDVRQNLPGTQRGGGAGLLAGNQLLLLGGNDGEYPTLTPKGTATVYDLAGDTFTDLPANPGASLGGTAAPLPDGTSLIVIDGAVLRYNPL